MKAVVTGASGLVGGNLALELIARGGTVRATRRARSSIAHLVGHPIEWVSADVTEPDSLEPAFSGMDAVFHCAAVVSTRKTATKEMIGTNVDGTRNVLRAARHVGVKRLVHCSTVNAIGLSEDGKPCTEEARWNFVEHGMADGYTLTKHEAEQVLSQEGAELDWVIANPTYMLGPNDTRPTSGKLIVDVVKRKIPACPPGANNFVDVRDVARGMIAAWQKGKRGERYILAGHDMTYGDVMGTIARVAGVKPPRFKIPEPVAKLVGKWGDFVERRGKDPLVNSTQIRYAFTDRFRFKSDKAARELGYTVSPLEPAIADAIAWFRANGML